MHLPIGVLVNELLHLTQKEILLIIVPQGISLGCGRFPASLSEAWVVSSTSASCFGFNSPPLFHESNSYPASKHY